jgi:hypothetical protein
MLDGSQHGADIDTKAGSHSSKSAGRDCDTVMEDHSLVCQSGRRVLSSCAVIPRCRFRLRWQEVMVCLLLLCCNVSVANRSAYDIARNYSLCVMVFLGLTIC